MRSKYIQKVPSKSHNHRCLNPLETKRGALNGKPGNAFDRLENYISYGNARNLT